MPTTLQIAMPTLQTIHAKTVLCMFSAFPQVKVKHALRIFEGMSNLDVARSILLTDWHDTSGGEDLFLFIDSDQTFRAEDINNLIDLGGDVSIGAVAGRRPNSINVTPADEAQFTAQRHGELLYGGTAFMLIRKPILQAVVEYLVEENGTERIWVSDHNPRVIPFFKQRLIPRESPGEGPAEWLGEDYSFCWLVRHVGGTIRGLISETIGHEMSQVKYIR